MPRDSRGWDATDIGRYWRRRLCYTQRAGVTSKIKRRLRRRERRQGKAEANGDWWVQQAPTQVTGD